MARDLQMPENAVELITNPQIIRAAFAEIRAHRDMEVHMVPPGNVAPLSPGNRQILGDPPNLILPLPLQFTRSIDDSTATAASVSTQLNLLLAELRKNRQLPS